MSLEFFEGPAGSGKTYQLIEAVKRSLTLRPFADGQAVLGLTYMHGSRKRMHHRLSSVTVLRGRFNACTVDSLARQIVFRWRTLAIAEQENLNLSTADFSTICRIAARLLEKQTVADWLAVRYPLIVVDELQDCRGERLRIIQCIERRSAVLAAADEFQDLHPEGVNAAVEWLHSGPGTRTLLSGNHRTKTGMLLNAARQLRLQQDCGNTLGSTLQPTLNANVAAACVARSLTWNTCNDVAILTPTGPEKSSFVREVIERLTTKPISASKLPKPVGPFQIAWESNIEGEKDKLMAALAGAGHAPNIESLKKVASSDTGALRDLFHWAEHKCRVKGQSAFSVAELSVAVDRILHSRRAFTSTAHAGAIRAMTIDQAKNREFDGVVLLWPFSIGGDVDSQRRRLYNALTRAKKWATVIVQENPKGPRRLSCPPFSKAVVKNPTVRVENEMTLR